MKGLLRFRLVRWTRQLRIWLGQSKGMESQHYLFTLKRILTPQEIWDRLWKHGWGYNTMSHTYKHQIFTLRKPDPPRHQWHLRFYDNGAVSGHYEVDPIQFLMEHLDGVDLRTLNINEINELLMQLEYPFLSEEQNK